MATLSQLIPTKKHRVYDILEELNFDMTDWTESLTNKNVTNKNGNPSANPKYCFNWSFVRDDEQLVVLNLWHEEMEIENGIIFQKHKFKHYALEQSGQRKTRSLEIDNAVRLAYEKNYLFMLLFA